MNDPIPQPAIATPIVANTTLQVTLSPGDSTLLLPGVAGQTIIYIGAQLNPNAATDAVFMRIDPLNTDVFSYLGIFNQYSQHFPRVLPGGSTAYFTCVSAATCYVNFFFKV